MTPDYGVDLHSVVRDAITSLHPDEPCLWWKASGQENVKGRILPLYEGPVRLMAQIQSVTDEKIQFEQRSAEDVVERAFYLRSERSGRVAGIVRPQARSGDFLRREIDGTWWLVTAVLEDFSLVEWSKVKATLQVTPPDAVLPLNEGGHA